MTTKVNEHFCKNRYKKHKKRNKILQNAKGFAKLGIFGRGSHIEDDQFNYFINILDTMKLGFENIEEKVNMANNVFEQTNGSEIHLASNQIVSKALESLLPYVNESNLERYFAKFAESFRPICSDMFASHVLQKMIEIAFLRSVGQQKKIPTDSSEETTSSKKPKMDHFSEESYNMRFFPDEHREICGNFVTRISKFLLNNLEDFVWDPCGNHIMRTCLRCLAGIYTPKVAFNKSEVGTGKEMKKYCVRDEWLVVLKEFPNRLEMWPQFIDLPYEELTSALLGVICLTLKVVDKSALKHFGKKILMDCLLNTENSDEKHNTYEKIKVDDAEENLNASNPKNDDTTEDNNTLLPKVFKYTSSIRLLETLLNIAGTKLSTQLYAMLFIGHIPLLALKSSTNFTIQRLVENMKEKEYFDNVYVELHKCIDKLLYLGHTGVVLALSSTCLRLSTKQSQFLVGLQLALHTNEKDKTKYFFKCLLKLKPYEVVAAENKNTFVHLHGSLIIQNLLRFNKPILLVNAILETPPEELTIIFNTANGSHIVDAFLQSEYIGEKSREKLIRSLDGFYIDLAINKFGSRVIENLFGSAQDSQKLRIVKVLSDKFNMLNGTAFGRLINRKLHVGTFNLSVDQWKAALLRRDNKAQQLFEDII